MMEFKDGDRVHVTRLDGEKVDFYATLSDFGAYNEAADLVNCTDSSFEGAFVHLPNSKDFGADRLDYYTLATDEEDTEAPEVQYIKRENKIELNDHYIIEVKKGLYVQNVTSNYFFRFTKYINKAYVYEYKNAALKHAEFVDGSVLNLKRYIEE